MIAVLETDALIVLVASDVQAGPLKLGLLAELVEVVVFASPRC
jgi:hypothetical protein